MIEVQDIKTLTKLKHNNKLNERALVKDTHSVYKWNGSNWEFQGRTGIDTTLFQLNQSIMTGMPAYEAGQISAAKTLIDRWHEDHPGTYYMLLSNEQHYYTVLHIGNNYSNPVLENAVIDECLSPLGAIKDVSINDDDVVECWVTIGSTSYVYYLFNYDEGVVECV